MHTNLLPRPVLTLFAGLLGLLSLSISHAAYADWYESSGSAPIVNNDVAAARAEAVTNALRQSLDFSGGRVASVEQVVDGVLTGDFFEWSAEGSIEQAEIVRERIRGDRIEVTIRANIRQDEEHCPAASFRKAVTLVPFEFNRPEQARDGDLWELERAASERFAQLLAQNSNSLFLEHRIDRKIGVVAMRAANNDQQLASFARRVGKETDAQYVLAAVFDDISTEQRGRNYTFWTPAKQNRNMALTLYVLDGASGDLITRANVRGQTVWGFDYNESVDVYSQRFWDSAYGNLLQERMQDLVYGIDERLSCEEPRGQVVAVTDNQVTVNLGANHGVEAGQTLHIYHRGNFIDDQGIYREQWVLSPYRLSIAVVARSSALTQVAGDEVGGNIQVNDRVVVR